MDSSQFEMMLCEYLSRVSGKEIESASSLEKLDCRELLSLLGKVDDKTLYWTIHLLKSSENGRELFEKLMGDHEDENRELVDGFFKRYMDMILVEPETGNWHNPLVVYIRPEFFQDLAFIQTRQPFFMRQTISDINDFLTQSFGDKVEFKVDEQGLAWEWFWERILREQSK